MKSKTEIQWKEYHVWKPQHPGYFLAIQNGIVGAAFYSFGASSWKTFMSSTDEVKADNVTHWAYFPDIAPVLDGSEPIGGKTLDEYLDGLVKKATPAWEGVDPEKFLDEVRGRTPFDQAVSLLRSLADLQNGPPLETYREQWESTMAAVHEFLRKNEV